MRTNFDLSNEKDRRQVIADYLATKPRTNSYAVTYSRNFYEYSDGTYCDHDPYYEITFLKEFTDEQIEIIRELLVICEEEGIDITEATYGEEDKFEFLNQDSDSGQYIFAPEKVDLETVHHRYLFKYGYFPQGIEEKPRIFEQRFVLSDEEYMSLIDWKLQHQDAGFMALRHDMPEMFEKLAQEFDSIFCSYEWQPPFYGPTYFAEMTEIDEDVKKILASIESKNE